MILYFKGYKSLKAIHPEIAEELLEVKGEGEWQNNEITCYRSAASFARYEVQEGWYASLGIYEHDYNGAPDLKEFIDFEKLGDALVKNMDESIYYLTEDGCIVYTPCGW